MGGWILPRFAIRGTLLGGVPIIKDYSIFEVYIGVPVFWETTTCRFVAQDLRVWPRNMDGTKPHLHASMSAIHQDGRVSEQGIPHWIQLFFVISGPRP